MTMERGASSRHWLLRRDEEIRRRVDASNIVAQAHALVHEGGTASLSMRTLASKLGTSTSALYRHIPSKQWLLIAIVDLVLSEVDTEGDPKASPRGRLEALAESYRRVLIGHPHLHEVLTSQVALTPNSVRIADAALRSLGDFGIRGGDLVDAYNAWCGYVIGFTILETKPPDHAPEPDLQDAMREELERAVDAEYPTLAVLIDDVANRAYGLRWQGDRLGNGHTSFEWGLDSLLDGFERRTKRRG
jgi:AcrR family transcriptional regulator